MKVADLQGVADLVAERSRSKDGLLVGLSEIVN